MSVVIRKVGNAAQWTCTVVVKRDGKKQPCRHVAVADTEENARKEYDAHRKQVHR